MEALSVAANIAAIIQIADRVIELCRYYIGSATDAPSDLRVILLETSSMRAVLDNLQFLQDSGHCPEVLRELEKAGGPIQGCQTVITELNGLLPPRSNSVQSGSGSRKHWIDDMIKVLAWPLKETKARKLLKELASYKATIEFALTTEVAQDIKEIKHTTQTMSETLTDFQQQQMHEWLHDTDPSSLHEKSCNQYERGTGDWVLRSERWTEWTAAKSQCLWIHGIPGAGKTILLSHLFETLSQGKDFVEPGCVFAYYYCYFNRNQDEAVPFLKWVISEICYACSSIPSTVLKACKQGRRASVSQLLNILEMAVRGIPRAYIFVDALDESQPRDGILRVLRDLVSDPRFRKIQIVATSREYIDIEETMTPISSNISMRSSLLDEDIRLYIRSQLSKHHVLKHWSEELQEEVYKALADKAHGMFRWVICQLDVLRRLKYDRDVIMNALATLPATLDKTYERLFLEIPEDAHLAVHFALQWIFFWNKRSHNHFPRDALNSIIHHSVCRQDGGEKHFDYNDQAILEFCGCLVTKDSVDTLSLAHYTVWEFLVSPRIKSGPANPFYVDEIHAEKTAILTALEVCADEKVVPEVEQKLVPIVNTARHHNYRCVLSVCAFYLIDVLTGQSTQSPEVLNTIEKSECLVAKLMDSSEPLFQRFALYFRARGMATFHDFTDSGLVPALWHHRRLSPDPGDRVSTLINRIGFYVLMGERFVETREFLADIPQNADVFDVHIAVSIPFRRRRGPHSDSIALHGTVLDIVIFWLSSLRCWESWFDALSKAFDITRQLQMAVGHHCYASCLGCYKDNECRFLDRFLGLREAHFWPRSPITPLQIAVGNRDPIAVKHLLRAGADANETGDCTEPRPEKGTFFSAFDHLHGLSPLYILRNVEIVYAIAEDPTSRFSSPSAHREELGAEIDGYLLQAGATEFQEQCTASCIACGGDLKDESQDANII